MTTIIMRTSEGDIKINLFDDETPETVLISSALPPARRNGSIR